MTLKFILSIMMMGFFVTGYACKCGGPGTVKESYETTDLIIYGRVASIDTVLLSETVTEEDAKEVEEKLRGDQMLQYFKGTYVLRIGFEIVEKYKGQSDPAKAIIYTPWQRSACGFSFKKGKEYILYASTRNSFAFIFQKENEGKIFKKENTFWTTRCTRTAEYSKQEAEELSLLKE